MGGEGRCTGLPLRSFMSPLGAHQGPCGQTGGAIISPFFSLFLLIPTASAPSGRSDTFPPLPLPLPFPLPFRFPLSFPHSL